MPEKPPARHASSNLTEAMDAARNTLTPKYASLRGDQLLELDAVARGLQAIRTKKEERITANTLIRLAVDLLLAHRGRLLGDTEEELRTNLLKQFEEGPTDPQTGA